MSLLLEPDDPAHAAACSALAGLAAELRSLTDALADHAVSELSTRTVVGCARDAMPGADHVDLSAWCHDRFRLLAADPDYPAELDRVRNATGEGPCFDALAGAAPALSADLAGDARWPRYGAAVVERTGVRSAVSYRIRLPEGRSGVLSCYSDWPYGFDELAVATGSVLAAACSVAALAAERPTAAPPHPPAAGGPVNGHPAKLTDSV